MARARFSIGIDLGTTNCAAAFVPLDGEARSELLAIPQWETLSSLTEASTLPSFLYFPEDAVANHNSQQECRRPGMDNRQARPEEGRKITRKGRPFPASVFEPGEAIEPTVWNAVLEGLKSARRSREDFARVGYHLHRSQEKCHSPTRPSSR